MILALFMMVFIHKEKISPHINLNLQIEDKSFVVNKEIEIMGLIKDNPKFLLHRGEERRIDFGFKKNTNFKT